MYNGRGGGGGGNCRSSSGLWAAIVHNHPLSTYPLQLSAHVLYTNSKCCGSGFIGIGSRLRQHDPEPGILGHTVEKNYKLKKTLIKNAVQYICSFPSNEGRETFFLGLSLITPSLLSIRIICIANVCKILKGDGWPSW
jgi:hypothetical protein